MAAFRAGEGLTRTRESRSRRRFYPLEKGAEGTDDRVVPFAQQGGEDVLADSFTPEMVPAVTSRERHSVEIDPMLVITPDDVITPVPNPASVELEAPLEAVKVDAAGGVEVDVWLCHFLLPLCSPSQLVACSWHAINILRERPKVSRKPCSVRLATNRKFCEKRMISCADGRVFAS